LPLPTTMLWTVKLVCTAFVMTSVYKPGSTQGAVSSYISSFAPILIGYDLGYSFTGS
jgi:hypothetical protein